MNIRAAISVCFATICLTASSQTTVRDLRLDAPVDTNTIAVAYQQVTNAIATAVRLGQLDQASLARAIAVGQDLHLIKTSTNGWVVGVSNIVEVDQAHIPGVLFVGGTIYGAPVDGGHILLDGCDFYYNRQIPGASDPEAGLGNLVTDPYMDWRLGSFFQQWGATNAAMWAALMDINNLPASLAADLQAYSSATGGIAQSISQLGGIRDEINATNAVIRSAIEQALSQASGGGGSSWTSDSTDSYEFELVDHVVMTCSASDSSYYITLPTWNGTPARCVIWFSNANDWQNSSPSFYFSTEATVWYDDYLSTSYFWSNTGMYYWELRQVNRYNWFISSHPVGGSM
jgi:hypothetical protein